MLGISPSSCTTPGKCCGVRGGSVGLRKWQPGAAVPVLFKRNGILGIIGGHWRLYYIWFAQAKPHLLTQEYPWLHEVLFRNPHSGERGGFPLRARLLVCLCFCCFSVWGKERFNPETSELNKMVLCSTFLCPLKLKMKFREKKVWIFLFQHEALSFRNREASLTSLSFKASNDLLCFGLHERLMYCLISPWRGVVKNVAAAEIH